MPRRLEQRVQTAVMSNCLETRQAEPITASHRLTGDKLTGWYRVTLYSEEGGVLPIF